MVMCNLCHFIVFTTILLDIYYRQLLLLEINMMSTFCVGHYTLTIDFLVVY